MILRVSTSTTAVESTGDLADLLLIRATLQPMQVVKHRRFTPEKLKFKLSFSTSAGENNPAIISFFSQSVDNRSPGITETQHFSDLVKRLSGGVVHGTTKQSIPTDSINAIKMRMAAGDSGGQKRKVDLVLQLGSQDMTFNMVNSDQRQPQSVSKGFGKGDADQQCPYQTGTTGDRDPFQIVESDTRLLQ